MADNEKTEVQAVKQADKPATHEDHVLAVSRHADGSPAQSPEFTVLDKEFASKVSEKQLTEQAVSAADHAARSALLAERAPDVADDPLVAALRAAHDAAGKAAAGRVKSEIR